MSLLHSTIHWVPEPLSDHKSRLLPRLGILSIANALLVVARGLLGKLPETIGLTLLAIVFFVGMGYLAWVILRTRDLVSDYLRLSRIDRWFCRWSGPICTGISTALFVFSVWAFSVAKSTGGEPIWIRSNAVLSVIYFVMEIAFVLAVTCCACPSKETHIRPLVVWKLLCLLQTVVYGAYIFFGGMGLIIKGFSLR